MMEDSPAAAEELMRGEGFRGGIVDGRWTWGGDRIIVRGMGFFNRLFINIRRKTNTKPAFNSWV